MNVQQAAAIYVRGILEQSTDKLIDLIHDDFETTHGTPIREADHRAVYEAVRAIQNEIAAHVTDIDMREAVNTLNTRAWEHAAGGAEQEVDAK